MFGFDIVLVHADADIGGADFYQFADRVLQAAADRNGAPHSGCVIGKFLPSDFAGGVDAGSGFVDDDVAHGMVSQRSGNRVGHQLFGFAAADTVADRDHVDVVLLDQFGNLFAAFFSALFIADDEQVAGRDELALAVYNGD